MGALEMLVRAYSELQEFAIPEDMNRKLRLSWLDEGARSSIRIGSGNERA